MTTPLDLEQFAGHTPGPWGLTEGNFIVCDYGNDPRTGNIVAEVPCQGANDKDLPLIAAAPALLALAKEQREQIKKFASALQWIELEASRGLSCVSNQTAAGRTARAVLERIGLHANKTRAALAKEPA